MNNDFDLTCTRYALEQAEGWDNFTNLPHFAIPPGVQVQMMPPIGGALIRLCLWKGPQRLSIYFDTLDRLGSVGQPYYEIYPNLDRDISRFIIGEEDRMSEEIARIFSPLQIGGSAND